MYFRFNEEVQKFLAILLGALVHQLYYSSCSQKPINRPLSSLTPPKTHPPRNKTDYPAPFLGRPRNARSGARLAFSTPIPSPSRPEKPIYNRQRPRSRENGGENPQPTTCSPPRRFEGQVRAASIALPTKRTVAILFYPILPSYVQEII